MSPIVMIWQIFSGHRNVEAFHHKSSKNQSINAMFDWCGKSIKFLTCALANGELLRLIGKIQKASCFPFNFAMNCFVNVTYKFLILGQKQLFFSIKFQFVWVILCVHCTIELLPNEYNVSHRQEVVVTYWAIKCN